MNGYRWMVAVALMAGTVLLASCGGGGGPSTPAPVTQTVACPNGTSKSGTGATSTDALTAATEQCAGPQMVSISPANASTTVSADTFTSVDVTTDSTLDASSINSATITLTAGTTAVPGTASAVGIKGFKFVPTSKLAYGQAFALAASVKDTLGKTLVVISTFTTAQVVCTLPATWNGTACADPVLHYTDKVYAVWTDAYPFVVTRAGAVRVRNMTQYDGPHQTLFNCAISSYSLADGKIPLLCKDLANNRYRELYINPERDELYEYVGTLPSELGYTLNASGNIITSLGAKWGDLAETFIGYDHHEPTWWSAAKIASGWFYTKSDSIGADWILTFQDNAGATSIVKAGTAQADGNLRIMFSYSH